ncbi:cell division protein ZapA [Novosphingobium sp. KCTC 2891]|nr:cell division protein ZapA [Novosphingobium sp. KCTC 2891]
MLQIGNRPFTVSAATGEESHIEMLGRMIEDRVGRMAGGSGQSETRMLLFAALVLADELHEAHKQAPPPAPPTPEVAPEPEGPSPEMVARVEALAARVEKLAAHLEQTATDA